MNPAMDSPARVKGIAASNGTRLTSRLIFFLLKGGDQMMYDVMNPEKARKILYKFYGRPVFLNSTDDQVVKIARKLIAKGWLVVGDNGTYLMRNGEAFTI